MEINGAWFFARNAPAFETRRLVTERRQPEPANPRIMNRAEYPRREARQSGPEILDTTATPIDACVERLRGCFG